MIKGPNYIWVQFKNADYNKLIIKLHKIDANFYDIKQNKKNILIKTTENDYKRIKKYLISEKTKIVSYTGINKIKLTIKKYYIFFIALFLGLIYLFIINNMVIKIEIVSNDSKVINEVKESLDKYGLKRLSFKKRHRDIEIIVDKILTEKKDLLEWIEIKYDGLIMVVNVTEKVKEKKEEEKKVCDIVAKEDAKIISYNINKGDMLAKINQYVYKDEVIVTGVIKYNEKIKELVCASATIYGEVWYKVDISVPYEYQSYEETGKKKINFKFKTDKKEVKILRSRFKKTEDSDEVLYKLNDFQLLLTREKELKLVTTKLTEKEAYERGIKLVHDKINLKLDKDEEILEKKVLKKVVNDSTIDLEVFVVTKEKIGEERLVEEVRLNDNNGTIESN